MKVQHCLYLSLLYATYGFVLPTNGKYIINSQTSKIGNWHIELNSKNKDDNEEENKFDIIEGIGGFMGYPKERKWKGFRIACYSIFAGSILRSAVVDLGNYIDKKIDNDALDQFSNVAVVVEPKSSVSSDSIIFGSEKIGYTGNIKVLDEPYLCESTKFI